MDENTTNRVSAGVPTGGQFATTEKAEPLLAGGLMPDRLLSQTELGLPTEDPDLEFHTDDGVQVVIVPPQDGNGEDFYWELHYGGWTWDGNSDTLEDAQSEARDEAERMVWMRESGDYDEGEDEDDGGW